MRTTTTRGRSSASTGPRPTGALFARAAAGVVLAVAMTSCASPAPRGSDHPAPGGAATGAAGSAEVETGSDPAAGARRALRLLTAWDARRSEALAHQDRAALAQLYAPGAGLLRQDLTLLRGYDRRGVRVVDVVTQVREVEVLAAGPDRVQVRAAERLAGAGFRTRSGDYRRTAGTAWGVRVLTLERGQAGWRLSSATRG